MAQRSKLPLVLCAGVLCCSAALAATPIAPACGDTIGPGGKYILTADLGPCDTSPALTVDSASLNLGRHTISGSDLSGTGVVLTGTGAVLRNGTIRDFQVDGVYLVGDGQHVVRKIVSRNNGLNGFNFESDANTVRNCEAIENVNNGFDAESNGNWLRGSTATGNGSNGFSVDGTDNRLARNRAITSSLDGFNVRGVRNMLVENRSEMNSEDGFDIGLFANDTELVRNNAVSNGEYGFSVTSVGSRIVECRARDSFSFDARDLRDACISNTWRRNDFSTVFPSCIR